MSNLLAVFIMLSVVLGASYWYSNVSAVCQIPVSYKLGDLDGRFGLTRDEVKLALLEAESVWEKATERNLFNYSDASKLTVNFIFDERQQLTEDELSLREKLNVSENVNEAFNETYAELTSRYEQLKSSYQQKSDVYDEALSRYNATVAKYNDEGGAPRAVFEELKQERRKLDTEANLLNKESRQLNELVNQINSLSEQGNKLVEKYNENVSRYNDHFGESREFTEGEYRGDAINIFSFQDRNELRRVLAHELGHAISLNHVANENSIMYYLVNGAVPIMTPSNEDLEAFAQTCGMSRTTSFWVQLKELWYKM